MGSLGEEDLEKLVLDYFESSPITNSDHIETSSTALINLQVSIYLFSTNAFFSSFFLGKKTKP